MTWAARHILSLSMGTPVQFRPHGNSMSGRINDGDLVTVVPCNAEEVTIDDVVLCRVRGCDYLHIVKAVRPRQVLIGNNKGKINGWTSQVYGRVVEVAP